MPLNRNLYATSGTLAGSPVTLDPVFDAAEWQITNRDASLSMIFTVSGQPVTIPAGGTVLIEIVAGSATINGTGDYEIEAAEVPGSLGSYR